MQKIPTLFVRQFEDHKLIGITPEIHPGMEWVLEGGGIATEKMDGACCALLNGKFYRRFDAKPGRKIPQNAIPCCPPDPVTGHHPHWVPVDNDNPADQWFVQAFLNTHDFQTNVERKSGSMPEGTYEAVGPHFQSNPYHLGQDYLVKHGNRVLLGVPRTFEGVKEYLRTHNIEGIVFWKDDAPQCKIKRTDFGFAWPEKGV